MQTAALLTTLFMIMTIGTNASPIPDESNTTRSVSGTPTVSVQNLRGILGTYDTNIHTKGQLRTGYITSKKTVHQRTNAYALGGHVHFDTQRWNGLMVALSVYTVLDLGINQNPLYQNPDFFDDKGKSFAILSKAFIDGKWGNTQLRLGRQALDTPLADSDDIRMMPNYFQAYTLTNTDIEGLTLTAGYIDKMAGWENGVDASRFVGISEVLGTVDSTRGVGYVGTLYEGIEDLSVSLWYYHYDDIADAFYTETGYTYTMKGMFDITIGLQYAQAKECGKALLQQRDASTYGVTFEVVSDNGISLMAAYNEDNGQTGAVDLSLGGGPFFTSMEDQTIDAIAGEGSAWMTGAAYDMTQTGIEGLTLGIAYGEFKADTPNNHYHTSETDAIVEYNRNDRLSITCAYALIDHKDDGMADYDQLRVIGSYSF